ncbi:MAG: heme o synthase [Fimbriimonadaceae bacterium]|nr:heme o synthase [Alphaproteobacteria bacterium]
MSDQAVDIGQKPLAIAGGGEVSDFFALLKPRVMSLVIFTALVGLVVAPGSMHPVLAATALLCIAVGAGASGALNMWYEADIDARMERTANRPIPAGRMDPQEALAFAVALAVGSVLILGLLVNWVAGALLAFTIFFYFVIYTVWLKRATPYNIVIGGAAGALPPMVGWAAATGTVSFESFILFAIIFMWTPPHFWALALYRSGDYERAGIPMLPVVAGDDATRRQIFIYSLLLVPLAITPSLLGFAGLIYGLVATLSGVAFLFLAWQVWAADEKKSLVRAARKLFAYSILYLLILFATLLVEQGLGLEIPRFGFADWLG